MNRTGISNLGLFTGLSGATFTNIYFKNITIIGNEYFAILSSTGENVQISNIIMEDINMKGVRRFSWLLAYSYGMVATNITVISATSIGTDIPDVGGIFGFCATGITINKCGVISARINGFGKSGAICAALGESNVSEVYAKDVIFTVGTSVTPWFGGLFGYYLVWYGNSFLNNSYSRATFLVAEGTNGTVLVGGLIGELETRGLNLTITNCYSDSNLNGTDESVGNVFGGIQSDGNNASISLSNVYYKNNNNFPAYPNTTVPNNTTIYGTADGLSCLNLYNSIIANYSNSTWGGNNLLSEYNYMYGGCTCCNSTSPPSTLIPSTSTPSTLIPSTFTPSTTPPSTLIPSTLTPSTIIPSTSFPSTTPPSTLFASTTSPTSLTPSTFTPSTLTPSTLIPSTSLPSTTDPSTSIPSTIVPSQNCLYDVDNCEKCGMNGIIVDISQFNISCVQSGNDWVYSFSNKNSNTTTISQTVTLNQTSIIIQGNLNQTSNSTIVIVINNENKNGLNVTGCVSLNGNLSLILNERPQNGNISIQLVTYNCTQQLTFNQSQFSITPKYKNNKCDNIKSTLSNQQNTLSVSLSSTLGSNCKTNIGLIIGLCVGIPVFLLFLITLIILVLKARTRRQMKSYGKRKPTITSMISPNSVISVDTQFSDNQSFQQQTRWKDTDFELSQIN
eukprot:TRINITY_DN3200_c0_g1_i7.p1 TRINITY_DN3200_c0_g1~~TRINITY_DN3200_c0_g1_i7.p1  ORF type:complete len:674 (-),score=131.70 TRINITY_DN3200_c0_g1_i7:31-2052(-)